MVIMERTNQARQLCTLLQKMLLSFIKKDKEHRVTLQWLEKFFKRHAECCFSWMQWTDAKQWFTAGTCDTGICYYLKRHLQDAPIKDIWKSINQYYDIQDYKLTKL